VLTDGEVTLRAHRLSDVDEMVVQCTDPVSTAGTDLPLTYSRDNAVRYATETMPNGWRTRTELGFAIEDGVREFAGSVSLRLRGDGIADIAYGLHPAARGRGVCRRAVALLLDWGFQQPEIDVVTWYAYVGNWASRRVAWATGFAIGTTVAKLHSQRGVRRDCWTGTLRADDPREPRTPWHLPPVLESDRLRLRPLRETDADRLGEVHADERTRNFKGRYRAAGSRDGAAMVLLHQERAARGERIHWCIADRATDHLVGQVQLHDLEGLDPTSAELGYAMHPDSRGRGVVTEALTVVADWAFRPATEGGFGRRRLVVKTAATNQASRHVAEKAGFVHVATEPASFPMGERDFDDCVLYHRLNPRWTP